MPQIQAGAVLYAKDFLRIADFYKSVAELVIRDTDKTHVRLESGSFQLVVHQIPKRVAETVEISEPPLRRENTPIKLVFVVESINKAREVVKTLGGGLNSEEMEWEFDGHKVCDGHDPEGNVFQLRASMR